MAPDMVNLVMKGVLARGRRARLVVIQMVMLVVKYKRISRCSYQVLMINSMREVQLGRFNDDATQWPGLNAKCSTPELKEVRGRNATTSR